MTVSELKYLIALNEVIEEAGDKNVPKLPLIARKIGVSKVSVYHGLERLEEGGFVERSGKQLVLTDTGRQTLAEYLTIIEFIRSHLQYHCGTPGDLANEDAIGAACAFSDVSRKSVSDFVKSGRKDR